MECLNGVSTYLGNLASRSNGAGRIRLNEEKEGQSNAVPQPVDILTLGSGWTWSFLSPAASERGYRTAFTTRDGRQGSIAFTFDPESDDTSPFEVLPDAQTIVVIFPLYSAEAARRLVNGYISTRSEQVAERWRRQAYGDSLSEKHTPDVSQSARTRFILLGSTGIWKSSGPTLAQVHTAPLYPTADTSTLYAEWPCSQQQRAQTEDSKHHHRAPRRLPSAWVDRHSPIDKVPRSIAEDAFLAFNDAKDGHGPVPTSVLCLSGLWGHGRSPRRYIGALAPTKERVAQLGSVHFIHGHDVARAILAMHQQWDKAVGARWLLTNERVYDLWDLISQWGNAGEPGRDHVPQGPQPAWIQELIAESRSKENKDGKQSDPVRALPRTPEQLGFAMDGADFWDTFGLHPEVPWVD